MWSGVTMKVKVKLINYNLKLPKGQKKKIETIYFLDQENNYF
jgi:hypothetical protein